MNIGYYFHPCAIFGPDGTARTEAHWGYFVRALAAEAGQVTFYAHSGEFSGTETLELGPEYNVRCVSLGPRRARPLMFAQPAHFLKNFRPADDGLDAMVVRAPTGLLAAMARRCGRAGVPVLGLLVDDTSNWRATAAFPWWRNAAIHGWLFTLRRSQERVARQHLMMAISKSIVRGKAYKRSAIVPTTSLSRSDLIGPAGRTRPWPTPAERIRLLFTGRLAEEKGIVELGDAIAQLVRRGYNVEVELVGADYGDPTINTVVERSAAAGIADRIIRSGFLEAGPALWAAYERADIFVSPTYGEGSVTRTIKEAFARGVPVVSTTIRENTEFLTDGVHAVLVPMREVDALANGIARAIDDSELRARMAEAGFAWVQDYTNERSAEIVANHIRDEVARANA